jgi:hypothetical protein
METPTDFYNKYKLISIPLVSKQKYPYIKEWQKIKKSIEIKNNENIGILTGKTNNIIIIDIDKKDNGLKTWKKWIKEYGDIDTPVVKTGGPEGGFHYYFKYDKDIKSSLKIKVNDIRIGIDIKSDGGQVVVPPSIVVKKYKWIKPLDEYKIKKIPKWLKDKILFS